MMRPDDGTAVPGRAAQSGHIPLPRATIKRVTNRVMSAPLWAILTQNPLSQRLVVLVDPGILGLGAVPIHHVREQLATQVIALPVARGSNCLPWHPFACPCVPTAAPTGDTAFSANGTHFGQRFDGSGKPHPHSAFATPHVQVAGVDPKTRRIALHDLLLFLQTLAHEYSIGMSGCAHAQYLALQRGRIRRLGSSLLFGAGPMAAGGPRGLHESGHQLSHGPIGDRRPWRACRGQGPSTGDVHDTAKLHNSCGKTQ